MESKVFLVNLLRLMVLVLIDNLCYSFSNKTHTALTLARYWFFLLLMCTSIVSKSQIVEKSESASFISQMGRIEFEISSYGSEFYTINGGQSGMLIMEQTDRRMKDGFQCFIHSVDTSLSIIWTKTIQLNFSNHLLGTEYFDGKYYLLYSMSDYRTEDMEVWELDARSDEIRKMEVSTVFPVSLTFFEVLDDHLIFAGYTNSRTVLLTYDFEEQKPRVVPGFYDVKNDILDILIDDEALMFTVIMQDRMYNKRHTIKTKTYTAAGDLVLSSEIKPGEKKNLIDGVSTDFYSGIQFMAGTYSRSVSQYSRGLYVTKFLNGNQQFINYHEFSDLNNFFNYLNNKQEMKIKARIERQEKKGKKAAFNYRLFVHDIMKIGDEYILVAEAYYPRYASYSTSYSGYPGSASRRANPSFLGYKYTHAIVVAFDRSGNLLWDNSFEIKDFESYNLEAYVVLSESGENVFLSYLDDNRVVSKVMRGENIKDSLYYYPINSLYSSDEVRKRGTNDEKLEYWFNKTMVAFGEQVIHNSVDDGVKNNREVFSISKIRMK